MIFISTKPSPDQRPPVVCSEAGGGDAEYLGGLESVGVGGVVGGGAGPGVEVPVVARAPLVIRVRARAALSPGLLPQQPAPA